MMAARDMQKVRRVIHPLSLPSTSPKDSNCDMQFVSLHSFTGKTWLLALKRRIPQMMVALCAGIGLLSATDLTIHLPNTPSITRQKVLYRCDATATRIGAPGATFPVEYINGGGNSLVVVPIAGNALIFSNVSSGSGARYTAQQYTWWEAKNSAILYSDSLTGKLQTACQPVPHK